MAPTPPDTAPLPTEPGACALCGARTGTPLAAGWDFEYGTTREVFALRRCGCGGAYLDPRPAPATLGRIYPADYYAYDFEGKLPRIVARVKGASERAKARSYLAYLRPGARVLDVGCVNAHSLAPLATEGVEFARRGGRGGRAWHPRPRGPHRRSRARARRVRSRHHEPVDRARPRSGGILRRIAAALAPGGHLFL